MPKLVRKTDTTPDSLKPYVFHGVELEPIGKDAVGDCPFCGREGKFSVVIGTSQYRCVVCEADGNNVTFIRDLYALAAKVPIKTVKYQELANDRGLESIETIKAWGLVISPLNGKWLIPGYASNPLGKVQLHQLYQYSRVGKRMALMPTPALATTGTKHALLGIPLYDQDKPEVYVAEGLWDGMRLWEVFNSTKETTDGKFVSTGSKEHAIGGNANVLATPSCSVFSETWTKWFRDKEVYFVWDNDHPKTHPVSGEEQSPASYEGMKRATARIHKSAGSVFYLNWGEEGFDPQLPDGYDLRDSLKNKSTGLSLIFNRSEPAPSEWLTDTAASDLQARPCTNWNQLILSWRKALKWTDGLEHGLACMLATVVSTNFIGDQLWMKIIGPASCGKSTLCEALSVNKQHILAKSTLRGFHSGFKTGDGKDEDNSLIPSLKNKTLVTKDGDTILQSPNKAQLLAEGRDLYDSVSRTSYRNKMGKDYEGIRMTWLLCGTSSLREIDESELGERFLDCVIMEDIDHELEDDICWRVANKAADHLNFEANGELSSNYNPEMLQAMQLTAGYINWLKENSAVMMPKIEFNNESKMHCIHAAKFVAYMRARPSKKQAEKAERELAARLVSQHIRLAKCLAFVTNKTTIDGQIVYRVKRVAMDTSRGAVLDIVKKIFFGGNAGYSTNGLRYVVNIPDSDLKRLLKFEVNIKALKLVKKPASQVWQLTKPLMALCKEML